MQILSNIKAIKNAVGIILCSVLSSAVKEPGKDTILF